MVGGIGPVNDELMELLYNKDNSYESGHADFFVFIIIASCITAAHIF